jgi:phage terminase small subunit
VAARRLNLTPRQQAFVDAYTSGPTLGNARQAAIVAGCPENSAAQQGHKWLKIPHIASAVDARQKLRTDAAVMDRAQMQKLFSDLALDVQNSVRDRISAAAWLGKSRGDFTMKHELKATELHELILEAMRDE